MSEVAGIITNRVVPLTRNEKTRAFIGRMVLRLHRQGRIFYRIEGTEYALTPAEYDMFLKRKVIVKDTPAVAEAMGKVTAPPISAEPQVTTSAATSTESVAAPSNMVAAVSASASKTMTSSTAKILSTFSQNLSDTTFFDAVKPEFKMEQPKASSVLEKRDTLVENARENITEMTGKIKNGILGRVKKNKAK